MLLAVAVVTVAVYLFSGAHHGQYDLKIYYNTVRFWLDGNSIYNYSQPDLVNVTLGFTYPPIAAVLMAPMTLLPLGAVVVVTVVAIVAANTALSFLFLRERFRLPTAQMMFATALVSAASFCLLPLGMNVGFGQINIFLALLVAADILILGKRGNRWFGVGIGLAMAIKLTPGIFLLYLVLSKRWRALVVAVLTAGAAILLAAVLSFGDSVEYYTRLVWQSDRVGFLDTPMNQSINGFIARLMSPEAPSRGIWLASSVLVAAVGIRRIRKAVLHGDTVAAITLTGLLGVLVSPVSWIHHAVWVLPAGILIGSYFRSVHSGRSVDPAGPDDPAPARPRFFLMVILTVTGLFVWVINTRLLFDLPETNFTGLPAIFEGSIQLIWILAALLILPIGGVPAFHSNQVTGSGSTALPRI
jgi:alpha-1,2-mannosyltransferase